MFICDLAELFMQHWGLQAAPSDGEGFGEPRDTNYVAKKGERGKPEGRVYVSSYEVT